MIFSRSLWDLLYLLYCTVGSAVPPVASDLISVLPFPGGSDGKASVCNAGDLGSIPGLGRSPGKGNVSPLQYSCLDNPMDHGAW